MTEPDFEQIAQSALHLTSGASGEAGSHITVATFVEQLRQVWNAAQADVRQRVMALPTLSRDEVAAYHLDISWVKTVDVIDAIGALDR